MILQGQGAIAHDDTADNAQAFIFFFQMSCRIFVACRTSQVIKTGKIGKMKMCIDYFQGYQLLSLCDHPYYSIFTSYSCEGVEIVSKFCFPEAMGTRQKVLVHIHYKGECDRNTCPGLKKQPAGNRPPEEARG